MTGAVRRFAMAAAIAALAAVALAACGGSSSTTVTASATQTQTSTPTQTAISTQTETATSTATSTSSSGGGGGRGGGAHIAVYHPSTIVRHNGFVTVISTPDGVGKVAAFYKGQLAKGGWNVRESSVNAFHAVFNATRGNQAVTIVVHPQGSGSGATITDHPA
jgi:hypothetical protein